MTASRHTPTGPSRTSPSLSVVIPAYNAAAWLPSTLNHLREAIAEARWADVEIVVVDDGSTDDTRAVLERDTGVPPVTVISQRNAGRFLARLAGLEAASGEYVMFCDARVFVHRDALRFLLARLRDDPGPSVWNGHAITADEASPVARFWDAIAFLAWRRYLRRPHTTSYGAEDYDYYPKGTTLFVAPRDVLLEACRSFDTGVDDLSKANDDTLLIRPLAARYRINISPSFSCTYHPRTSLRQFVAHSFHRGTVFVDGYVRPGTRYYRPYLALLGLSPVAAVAAIKRPRAAVGTAIGAGAALGIAAAAAGAPSRDAAALGLLSPLFAVCYGAGTLQGLYLRARSKRSRLGS